MTMCIKNSVYIIYEVQKQLLQIFSTVALYTRCDMYVDVVPPHHMITYYTVATHKL